MVCGKVNFTNLSRYNELNERTYRRHYKEDFEFAAFNQTLMGEASCRGAEWLEMMDCSFVAKLLKAVPSPKTLLHSQLPKFLFSKLL